MDKTFVWIGTLSLIFVYSLPYLQDYTLYIQRKDGVYTIYDPVGIYGMDYGFREKHVITYKDGIKEGPATVYLTLSDERDEHIYQNGQINGFATFYASDSSRTERIFNKNGEAEGKWVRYYQDGTRAEGFFLKGNNRFWGYVGSDYTTRYYPDGSKKIYTIKEGFFNSKVEGPYIYTHSEGDMEIGHNTWNRKGEYGVGNGPYIYQYSDGSIEVGTYKDGKEEGKYVYQDSNGSIEVGTYKDGERVTNDSLKITQKDSDEITE